MNKTNYSNKYFNDRDHLDLHLAQSIQILASDHKFKKILDVGCGTGRLVKYLNQKGFKTQGCEPAKEAVKIAQKINEGKLIKKASATALPYKTESFDLITSISVIEHLTHKEAKEFINEAKRVLRPQGFIIIITPNFSSPFRYIKKKKWFAYSDPTHINYFTPKSIRLLLASSGFANISFRFKTTYDISLNQYHPKPLRSLPMPVKNILHYLMFSSPLSTCRDSLWVSAQK